MPKPPAATFNDTSPLAVHMNKLLPHLGIDTDTAHFMVRREGGKEQLIVIPQSPDDYTALLKAIRIPEEKAQKATWIKEAIPTPNGMKEKRFVEIDQEVLNALDTRATRIAKDLNYENNRKNIRYLLQETKAGFSNDKGELIEGLLRIEQDRMEALTRLAESGALQNQPKNLPADQHHYLLDRKRQFQKMTVPDLQESFKEAVTETQRLRNTEAMIAAEPKPSDLPKNYLKEALQEGTRIQSVAPDVNRPVSSIPLNKPNKTTLAP